MCVLLINVIFKERLVAKDHSDYLYLNDLSNVLHKAAVIKCIGLLVEHNIIFFL